MRLAILLALLVSSTAAAQPCDWGLVPPAWQARCEVAGQPANGAVPGEPVDVRAFGTNQGSTFDGTVRWHDQIDGMTLFADLDLIPGEAFDVSIVVLMPEEGEVAFEVAVYGEAVDCDGCCPFNEFSFGVGAVATTRADADRSAAVDVADMIFVLDRWGTADYLADVNQDGAVDVSDLLGVILGW